MGRLGVDFGTSNTVLAIWHADQGEAQTLHVPDYGKEINYRRHDGSAEKISIIPSLIHYAAGNRRWIGQQVIAEGLYDSARTFRWMKRYICRRSPVAMHFEGRNISHYDAARDFLAAVLTFAVSAVGPGDADVGFTVPVESYEDYDNWLTQAAEASGMPHWRLIDEPTAAALGYGLSVQPGDVYLTFDFGGGTLDVSVVILDEESSSPGRRCRVLGKAGADIGGASIDGWIYQEVLRQKGLSESDPVVKRMSRALLAQCEKAKEQLSTADQAIIDTQDQSGKSLLSANLSRARLDDLLDQHQAYHLLDQTVRRALSAAQERGYSADHVKSVLMLGGSSLIPGVQRLVKQIFGKERVLLRRPLDAVARGAAAFVAGVDLADHIQHDYAIRHVDPAKSDYEYRVIVRKGTLYPTPKPVAEIVVKASYNGQSELGLAIFEMGERLQPAGPVELVFDPSGAARIRPVSSDDEERRYYFWVNEHNLTFLVANPPARHGEARFQVELGVDANKRLIITARDLLTNKIVLRDHPVVKLN
jgi:molecular chaperone DnaK (HSP70)